MNRRNFLRAVGISAFIPSSIFASLFPYNERKFRTGDRVQINMKDRDVFFGTVLKEERDPSVRYGYINKVFYANDRNYRERISYLVEFDKPQPSIHKNEYKYFNSLDEHSSYLEMSVLPSSLINKI